MTKTMYAATFCAGFFLCTAGIAAGQSTFDKTHLTDVFLRKEAPSGM